MKSSQGVKTHVRRKRRKDTSKEETADKMKPIAIADFENHTDGREFKQLQNMSSSQGLKTKVGKNRRQRRNKASNDTEETKPIVVADFENHTGVKKTSSVGKKRQRKASVDVKEKVNKVKMSDHDEVELIISRLVSWGRTHRPECFNCGPSDTMHHFDMVKDLSDEKEKDWIERLDDYSEAELDEEEEEKKERMELDKLLAAYV